MEDGVIIVFDGQSSPAFPRSLHPCSHTRLFWQKKDREMTLKSLWVHFFLLCFLHNPGRAALHSSRASERARSPGYHGPAHAAPQRPLVAAAPALSARRCQPFPRFLPPACDPLVAGTAGRAGTASFASIVSLRSPLPLGPLLLRGRAYTPSLLPPLQHSPGSLAPEIKTGDLKVQPF